MGWRNEYDVRERKEIEFCTLYAEKFNHNTEDHLSRLVVAKMAQRLDGYERLWLEFMSLLREVLPALSEADRDAGLKLFNFTTQLPPYVAIPDLDQRRADPSIFGPTSYFDSKLIF
jgi:hypothetical protein